MPPPDLSSYVLSDADSKRIFQDEILPAEFPKPLTPSVRKRPLAVLAVGQTGAGKTLLAPAILSALGPSSPKPAHFIADTYKTYHPEYTRLMLSSPQHASPATGPDARRWLSMAAQEAALHRLDVVLESACRHPDDFCDLVTVFQSAGYRVEVVVLAVPAALSRLGILSRFYERKPEALSRNLPVRLTPIKVHNDSYDGLLDAAKFLDATGVAHQVIVLRRGNLVAYGGQGSAAAAVELERNRSLTEAEMKTALDDIQNVSTHEEAKEQVEEVRELLRPLLERSDESGFPELVPLEFATKDGDMSSKQVLRLGFA
jgi:hypothetical protein